MKEDEEEKQQQRLIEGDREVYSSDDSDQSDQEDNKPIDTRIRGADIPIVRKLKVKNGIAVIDTKKAPQLESIMDIDEEEYNPHFAVNNVLEIKKRKLERE